VLSHCDFVCGGEIIRSSVSQELENGLHAKYVNYISTKMDMSLEITPMPFARRIQELRKGNLDLLVGIRRDSEEEDEFIYVLPSYEKLRHTFFIRKDDKNQLNNSSQLLNHTIGVTRHAKYSAKFSEQEGFVLVNISTLKQKIKLLMKNRIDTFIHYQESTLPVLVEMGLQNDIIHANFQPIEYHSYYVAITKKSRLFPHIKKLQSVIRQGIKDKDFANIRQQHYSSLPPQ
jgi:ABC-type amino acid transport substrate-binding protein